MERERRNGLITGSVFLAVIGGTLGTNMFIDKFKAHQHPADLVPPQGASETVQQKDVVTCGDIAFKGNVFEGRVKITPKNGETIVCNFPQIGEKPTK